MSNLGSFQTTLASFSPRRRILQGFGATTTNASNASNASNGGIDAILGPGGEAIVARTQQHVQEGIRTIGSKLQQLNFGKLIETMEQDQTLADQLEEMNQRFKEDKERRDIIRASEEACLESMRVHLQEFLQEKEQQQQQQQQKQSLQSTTIPPTPTTMSVWDTTAMTTTTTTTCPLTTTVLPTYEEWIEAIHPENAHDGQLIAGLGKEIDARFYIEESDHRKLWNSMVGPNQQVPPRGRVQFQTYSSALSSPSPWEPTILDLSATNVEPTNTTTTDTNGTCIPSNPMATTTNTTMDLIQFE